MNKHNILKTIAFGILAVFVCAGFVTASGETVNVSIGTLPAGKSISIIFDVTVNNSLPPGTTSVSQQGTVSGSNFSSVVTDDPKTILVPLDATVTQLGNELPVAGFGKALSFNGTDQFVMISDAGALTSAAYTVEAWVKFNAVQNSAIIQRLNAAETTSAFGLYLNSSGNFVHYADDGALHTVTATTIAEAGKWYHVAGAFSAGTMRLFVDGVEEGTPVTGISSLTGSMDHLNIGKNMSGRGDNYLNGQVDEVRLWNAALTESGIADWMYRGLDSTNLNFSSLAAYYKLDDGTGNTAADSVAAFDGSLQNMANANWVDSTINEWYTDEDVAFSGKLVGSDADGASTNGTDWALAFELVTDGTKGHVVIGPDNVFTYTPDLNENGDDTFTYKVKDAVPQDSNIFTVTVHIASVPDAPVLTKAFGVPSIPLNGTTTLTFTVSNSDPITSLSGIAFTDVLPAGLVVSSPNGISGSCGGGTITAIQGTNFISMTGASLAQSSSCIFSVNVTGTAAGTKNNTTGNVTSSESIPGGTASASIDVVGPPTIAKAFGASGIPLNGTTSLTFTITNPAANAVAVTGLAFSDTLPAGLVVSTPNNLTNTCGGAATAAAGSGSISLTGGTVAINSSCTLVVNVTGTAAGTKNNITGNVSSANGGTGNTATASLTVAAPPTIAKVFGAASIPLNGSTSLTFTITNLSANTVSLTGIAFTDNLPAGLVVSTPGNLTNTCGGTATAVDAASSVSLSGATLAINTSCTLSVNITGITAGLKNNSVTVTSNESGPGSTSNASIMVVAPPVIAKVFGAEKILLNGSTSLSFTIQNSTNVTTLAGIGFTDTLPAGLVVSTPNGLTGSCGGGTITADQGTAVISLTGAALAQNSSCTFSVNVTGTTAGLKDNSVTVTSSNGGTGNTSNASVTVVGPPTATAATDITKISFTAHWNASVGATGYRLDVAADSGFVSFVTGYNDLDVGNVTAYSVASGLISGKTYFYRVRAYFTGSTTESSNTIKLTTIGGKMSRNSWYLSPEAWIVRAYTKADAPNEVYLEVIDTGNNLVSPAAIAGMTGNPLLIASDAAATDVALGFDKAARTAHVTYTSAGGRQVVSVPGIRQSP